MATDSLNQETDMVKETKQILVKLINADFVRLGDNGEYIGITPTGEVTLGHTDNLESLYAYLIDFPTPDKW